METSELSEHTKEMAKGSIWSLAGNVSYNMLSFFYVIMVARAVSQDDLGLFYLALSIITLIIIFSTFGMAVSLSRYIPYFEGRNEIQKVRSLLKSSYMVVIIAAIGLIILLWWISDFIGEVYQNPQLPEIIRMLSVLFILSNLFKVNNEFLRGRSDMKALQINRNLQNLLKLILTFIFFYLYGASAVTLAIGYVLAYLVAMLLSFVSISNQVQKLPEKIEKVPLKQIFREIMPFGIIFSLITSIGLFLLSADSALLGYFTEPSEATSVVAIFTVATLFATLTAIFPNSIGTIFLPVMSRIYGKKNLNDMRSVTETAQRWSLFITVPITSILIAFSAEMLDVFYGPAYVSGAVVMSVFAFSILIKSVSTILSLALTSMRKVRLQLKILLIFGLMQILLDITLIPVYGMAGVAASFLISSICIVIAFSHYAKKLFEFRFSYGFYKLAASSLVLILLMLLIKPMVSSIAAVIPQEESGLGLGLYISKIIYLTYLGIITGLSFAIFMVMVRILKCFKIEDIIIIKKVMRKARMPDFLISIVENMASSGISGQSR